MTYVLFSRILALMSLSACACDPIEGNMRALVATAPSPSASPATSAAPERPPLNPVYQKVLDSEVEKTRKEEVIVSRYTHPGMSDWTRDTLAQLARDRREIERSRESLLAIPLFKRSDGCP